jgi:Ca2+-binding EF-hand superfamily protein
MARVIYILTIVVSASLAAVDGASAAAPTPKTATVDYVRDLIDDYYDGAERMRFFAAAGVDIELSAKEFQADTGKPKSFIRRYDRWSAALVYDKNRNKTLDWFEAKAYRQAVRQAIMTVFDANKDRRLTGDERDNANRWLATKKIGALSKDALRRRILRGVPIPASSEKNEPAKQPTTKPRPPKSPGMIWQKQWLDMTMASDANKDGKLSDEERANLYDAYRDAFRKRVLDQWDSDKNGEISKSEKAAMRAALLQIAQKRKQEYLRRTAKVAKLRKQALKPKPPIDPKERRRRMLTARFDKNRDGLLSSSEQAAMDAYEAKILSRTKALTDIRVQAAEQNKKHMLKWDTNGDGKISAAERQRIVADYKKQADQKQRMRLFDIDRDGRLNEKENAAMQAEQARKETHRDQKQQAELQMFDKNDDGQVSAAERQAVFEAARTIRAKRRKAMDANQDGKIEPAEEKAYYEKLQKKYDTNGDGKLSDQEKEKLRKAEYIW